MVGREPRQQRPPVAEGLVENGDGRLPVGGDLELDARPPRRVLEPRVPERPRVGEHAVEVEREGEAAGHSSRC